MTTAGSLTAVFVEQVTLTMTKELTGNLPAEGGSVSPGVGVEHVYDKGTEVDLVATAASGWRFKNWSGGASGTEPTKTITMNGDKTVTANFIQRHTITTTVYSDGKITPAGGTWDHGQSMSFNWEEVIRYDAPFHHWEGLPEDQFENGPFGPGTSTNNPVSVTIEGSYHLKAYCEDQMVELTADVNADGCEGCAVDPEYSEHVMGSEGAVTATPGEGWGFVRWEGDVPEGIEEDNPLVMLMDEDKVVTAKFGQVTLTTDAEEGGTVDPEPGEHQYPQDDFATITATSETGWKFDHWEGDVPEEDLETNPLELKMDGDKVVTAVFELSPCLLNLEGNPIIYELPQYVKSGVDALENLGKTVFGDFKFKVGGDFSMDTGTCQNRDATYGVATEYTGTLKLKFEKTDIPLIWGITTYSEIRVLGRKYKIKFSGGLRADVGADLTGTYSMLEYDCDCLDEIYCSSGNGVYSVTGGLSLAVDIGNRLVLGWETSLGNPVEAELCNVSLANIAVSGRMGAEQYREEGGCTPKTCVRASIEPIKFTVSVAIGGFNCTAIEMQYPQEKGKRLWDFYEDCANPG